MSTSTTTTSFNVVRVPEVDGPSIKTQHLPPGTYRTDLRRSLGSPRRRRGSSRPFHQHHAALAQRREGHALVNGSEKLRCRPPKRSPPPLCGSPSHPQVLGV